MQSGEIQVVDNKTAEAEFAQQVPPYFWSKTFEEKKK
jgi:hypothetical protein